MRFGIPETMGGDFNDNKLYKMKPATLLYLDPIIHAQKDITTDCKRFAIDYALRRI